LQFFETFCEARQTHKLHGNIIFISIGVQEQKLWHSKPKIEVGAKYKKITKSQ